MAVLILLFLLAASVVAADEGDFLSFFLSFLYCTRSLYLFCDFCFSLFTVFGFGINFTQYCNISVVS